MTEYLAALHEAAHGIIALESGWDVREIVLHKPGARQDEAGHTTLLDVPGVQTDRLESLIFLFAGSCAQRHKGLSSSGDSDDRARAWEIAGVFGEDPQARAQLLQRAELLAEARVRQPWTWAAITKAARLLVTKRRLVHYDLLQIVEEVRREQ